MTATTSRSILLVLSPRMASHVLEVGAFLERFGFQVATAASSSEALTACGRSHHDAIVFDLGLTEGLGMSTWLEKLNLLSPVTALLAIGEVANMEVLRQVGQKEDGDYVLLPLFLPEIKNRLRRLIEARRGRRPEPPAPAEEDRLKSMVGRSATMEAIRDRIRKIAVLSSTVLITGESGVGKELIARGIHETSPRRTAPFIALNCSALPENLLESELFGHERGAFTGAAATTKGKFELAHGGTLFLDEIGDMNPYTQAKFLRVLEEREFMRVGGSRYIRVDVRLVAATNANLERLMAEGRFREDLYYRLRVLTMEVPPLRARAEDIAELTRAFLDRFARTNGVPPKRLTDEALVELSRHRWPGNVRELRNTLENLIVSVPGDVIDAEDVPAALGGQAHQAAPLHAGGRPSPSAQATLPGSPGMAPELSSLEDMEARLIERTLLEVGGNRTRAARMLKIGVRTLQRRIQRYGLKAAD